MRPPRRLLTGAASMLVLAGAAFAAVSTLTGGAAARNGANASAAATSLASVREQSLSSQTQASGTLGYALPSTVVNLLSAGSNTAGASATGGSASVYTMLPQSGDTIRRGHPLYAVDDQPVLLLYGSVPAWREFASGMSAGRDVAELNANLRALGYGEPTGDDFSAATEEAVLKLQSARGLEQTGTLPLGSIVFKPGAVRVTSIDATLGAPAQAGPVLEVSSTRHQVTVQLDPSQQANVRAGERVNVTLPNDETTPGAITKVSAAATSPSADNAGGSGSSPGQGSSSTIEVDVRLLHEAAAGSLDQAPVQVAITTAAVKHALVVPVTALVALAGGGYAVETVSNAGTHHLAPVTLGLFDDADGLVQISGTGIHAGQRVVVPAT